jgi:hypothetical protein
VKGGLKRDKTTEWKEGGINNDPKVLSFTKTSEMVTLLINIGYKREANMESRVVSTGQTLMWRNKHVKLERRKAEGKKSNIWLSKFT